MRFFEMEDSVKWAAYKAQLALPAAEQDVNLLRAGKVVWASLVDGTVAERRRPHYALLDGIFMKRMVEAAAEHNVLELLTGSNAEAWEGYCVQVEDVYANYILNKPFEDEDERNVRDHFQRKWEVVKTDHRGNHFQRPLPMLTPNVVEGLGSLMGRISTAHTEVSLSFVVLAAVRHTSNSGLKAIMFSFPPFERF
jgi:hypothetical protein